MRKNKMYSTAAGLAEYDEELEYQQWFGNGWYRGEERAFFDPQWIISPAEEIWVCPPVRDLRGMAKEISYSVGYRGGYVYGGDDWIVRNDRGQRVVTFAFRRHWVRDYDTSNPEEFIEENMGLLELLPIGTELHYGSSFSSGEIYETWEKLTDNRFMMVDREEIER